MRKSVLAVLLLFLLATVSSGTEAKINGIYNVSGGCSCHGSVTVTYSLSGNPTTYSPGTTYSLSVDMTSSYYSVGGFSIEVTKGTLSNPGTNVKINSQGDSATHTTRSTPPWTVDWTAPSQGSGTMTLNLDVVGANANGQNSGDATSTYSVQIPEQAAPNQPPSAAYVSISPSLATTTDTLQLNYAYSDPDSDAESGTQIRWYRDGVLISALDDQPTVGSGNTSKGQFWNASITPSDGTDSGSLVESSTVEIVNSVPVVDSAAISPAIPLEGDELTLSYSFSDADSGDTPALNDTRWYVDGARIAAFDGEVSVPSIAVHSGDVWHAEITASDGFDTSTWFTTATVTVGSLNTAPTMTMVSISPATANTTTDLTVSWLSSDTDAGDSEEAVEIKWLLGGVEYPAVTTSTLASSHTEKGQTWNASVRVNDGQAWSDWLDSNDITIINSPPVLESFTIDSNTSTITHEFTLNHSSYDDDPIDIVEVDFEYFVNGQPQTGVLQTVAGDIVRIDARVHDGSDYSNLLSVTITIISTPPTISFNGSTTPDSLSDIVPELTTGDIDGDAVSITHVWLKNGFATNLGNATSVPANRLAPGDIWTLMATPNDGTDDGETISISFTIDNIAPIANITSESSVWVGLPTLLSASTSSDVDGIITDALWLIDGVEYGGIEVMFTPAEAEIDIILTVYDDQGTSANTSSTLTAAIPPSAQNLKSVRAGSSITITWEGSAENWSVYRDGVVLGMTSENTWSDSPTVVGLHHYNVYAVIGEVEVMSGDTITAELTIDDARQAEGPESGLGMALGIIMILVGGAGIASTFIPRRD
ncbi:MAG TPA: hypothetical protein EYN46_06975 [Candidatus Poseidoniales archaeon]|nr:hypothetical protein [Candidatus Poseidoniales archaeon]